MMGIALRIGAYLLILGILAFLGYSAWFATVWGFNPLLLFPLYIAGLVICGLIVLALWSGKSRGLRA